MGSVTRDERLGVKEVLAELGVSRTTFWRARASGIEDFPTPQTIGGLLYWRRSELAALEAALARYGGRRVFEEVRRDRRLSVCKRRSRPPALKSDADVEEQLSLFDAPEAKSDEA